MMMNWLNFWFVECVLGISVVVICGEGSDLLYVDGVYSSMDGGLLGVVIVG